jgi:hypothetical protein
MASVEDPDLAPGRGLLMDAPEVVVGQFPRGRGLEAGHFDPLWVHAPEDMADDAVLPPGVHGLEHHQDAVAPLGVEEFLERAEAPGELFQILIAQRLLPIEGEALPRIDVRKANRRSGFYAVALHASLRRWNR